MLTPESLASQIKTLEAQLAVLKVQAERLGNPVPPKSFADLYGILAGKVSSSEEEIQGALYRFDWEGTEIR